MTKDTSSEQQFLPLHDAHAIEQVLIVLQMAHPIDSESFGKVREVAKQFSGELPGKNDIQRFVMALGQEPSIGGQLPTSEFHGFVMSRTAPNGVVESELRLETTSITFRTTTYTRWQSVWDQASRYFAAVAAIYAEKNAISAVSLNYIDKFLWSGDPAKCLPNQLLRPQSPYICPHVYGLKDLWHSHTGAFLRFDDKTKRLLNVNVEYSHDNPINDSRRLVGISTVLTDMFNQPDYDSFDLSPEDVSGFLADRMRNLHDFSKSVFADVISDDMGKRVALYTSK